jgi:hypothetical protein
MSGATTFNLNQVSLASAQGAHTSVALNNKPLSVSFADLGKYLEISVKSKTGEDPYPEVSLSYTGKEINRSPDGKSFQIKIPVSEILQKANSGETHRILISTPDRNYAVPVKVDLSKLPAEYKTSTASAGQFYKGVFDKMVRSGRYELASLLIVMPRNSGSAKTNPEADPYYSGAHGALTVFSNSGEWHKVAVEKYQDRKDSLYSTHVFTRKLDPDNFTGAMKEEFEKLPPATQQQIRTEGTVRLNIQYYTHTLKGFDALLNNMENGNFAVVQTLGHRYTSFREKIYQLGQKTDLAKQPPLAYFGNHCNSRTSDNIPLSHVFNLFAPYGTNDSLFPGAELNLGFLSSLVTGNVDSLQQNLTDTYRSQVRPGVSRQAAAALFKETPSSGYNPYADPDGDHLPAYLDGDPANPNTYRLANGSLMMMTPNGILKVPFSAGTLERSVEENALSGNEFSSLGTAGKSEK